MEKITYKKTLDVHKNGVQFMLQGFETADKISRVVEISLMASGDAIDFPLEGIVAVMYVTTPNAKEPSINSCTIKDNKIVYEVLPIAEEGITEMQIKLIETSPTGAKSVLASPKFSVEVGKSNLDDNGEELKTTFTAIEDFIAKAEAVHRTRLERIELTNDCWFKAYYADGSTYETDILQKLFLNGNVKLSESYAHGGTGMREGEDSDNAMYYSNVAKSEALLAKDVMNTSQEMLEESRLHGVYTSFSVNFETGEVEYVSPSYKFSVNLETGELDASEPNYTFEDNVVQIVIDWLAAKGVVITDLQKISTEHGTRIGELEATTEKHEEQITDNTDRLSEQESTIEKILSSVKVDTYIGNGNVLEINLGGRPKAVLISDEYGRLNINDGSTSYYFGGLIVDVDTVPEEHRQVEITDNGFIVRRIADIGNHYHSANQDGKKRKYIAWL